MARRASKAKESERLLELKRPRTAAYRAKKRGGRNGEERARTLAERERVHLQRMLEKLDTWWPVHALKNPTAEKGEVARRLVSLINKRPLRGFSKSGALGVVRPSKGAHAKPFLEPVGSFLGPELEAASFFRGGETGIFGRQSGVVRASEFKWYDVEVAQLGDTQDQHVVSPLGAPGWSGSQGAYFWEGFARLDSLADDLDIFSGSPADRVVHMAVLRITPPAPTIDAQAVFRTQLLVQLPHGAEVVNDWGWWDDEDDASIKIDLCAAFQPGGGGFPNPSAFAYTSALSYGSSTPNLGGRAVSLLHSAHVRAGVSPNLYLGVRLTFEGADCRLQTGFTQAAADAYFRFNYPDLHSGPGLFYSYEPDLSLSIG